MVHAGGSRQGCPQTWAMMVVEVYLLGQVGAARKLVAYDGAREVAGVLVAAAAILLVVVEVGALIEGRKMKIGAQDRNTRHGHPAACMLVLLCLPLHTCFLLL